MVHLEDGDAGCWGRSWNALAVLLLLLAIKMAELIKREIGFILKGCRSDEIREPRGRRISGPFNEQPKIPFVFTI